jgi:hypothetical protein
MAMNQAQVAAHMMRLKSMDTDDLQAIKETADMPPAFFGIALDLIVDRVVTLLDDENAYAVKCYKKEQAKLKDADDAACANDHEADNAAFDVDDGDDSATVDLAFDGDGEGY